MKKIFLMFAGFILFSCDTDNRVVNENRSNVTVEYSYKNLEISEKLKDIVKKFVDSSQQNIKHGKIFIDRYSLDQSHIVITGDCDTMSNIIFNQPFLTVKYKQSVFDVFTGAEYLFLRNKFSPNQNYQLESSHLQYYIDSVDKIRYLGNIANPFTGYAEIIYTGDRK